jgi:hypothetical protein
VAQALVGDWMPILRAGRRDHSLTKILLDDICRLVEA